MYFVIHVQPIVELFHGLILKIPSVCAIFVVIIPNHEYRHQRRKYQSHPVKNHTNMEVVENRLVRFHRVNISMIYVCHRQIFSILINRVQVDRSVSFLDYDEYLFDSGPVTVDIPATRRVYETVKSGLERMGVNYPIGKHPTIELQMNRHISFI